MSGGDIWPTKRGNAGKQDCRNVPVDCACGGLL